MTDYEQRVSFLSKMAGVPRQEVDRVISYVNQYLGKKGMDAELNPHDISECAKVKLSRVLAILAIIAELNVNCAKYEQYINKTNWR